MGLGVTWIVTNYRWKEIAQLGPCDALTALRLCKIYSSAEMLIGFVGERPVECLNIREEIVERGLT